jgi:Zn-dependent peptidase ImmA (M78 family)
MLETHMQSSSQVPYTWRTLRQLVGLNAGVVLDLFEQHRAPIDVEKIVTGLDIVLEDLPTESKLSGEAMYRDGHQPVVRVNRDESAVRQRFTIAHELGHLLLHPIATHHRDSEYRNNGPLETEANAFAVDLLLPAWLVWEVAGYVGIDDTALANAFRVSIQAMKYRKRQLQLW